MIPWTASLTGNRVPSNCVVWTQSDRRQNARVATKHIADCLVRTILVWAILPATPDLHDVHDAAWDPSIIFAAATQVGLSANAV
jgi:hypothetical protein